MYAHGCLPSFPPSPSLPSLYSSRSVSLLLLLSKVRARDQAISLSSNVDRKVGRRSLGARLVRSPCLRRNWGKMKLTEQSDPLSPSPPLPHPLSSSRRSPSKAVGELCDSRGQSPSGRFNELQLGLYIPLPSPPPAPAPSLSLSLSLSPPPLSPLPK